MYIVKHIVRLSKCISKTVFVKTCTRDRKLKVKYLGRCSNSNISIIPFYFPSYLKLLVTVNWLSCPGVNLKEH